MSFFERFKDKTVTLLGAGVSNKPLVAKLAEGGAKIIIRDKKTVEQMGSAADEFVAAGAQFISGENYLDNILRLLHKRLRLLTVRKESIQYLS
jgi:UDP-N-acetylmuramoylalanine--D-glutamate ligase